LPPERIGRVAEKGKVAGRSGEAKKTVIGYWEDDNRK